MAVGFPAKTSFVNNDVYSASDVNDLAGTLNLIKPTAKGDLFAGSAANTYTKLAVGTDGQLLSADSTSATGLKYVTVNTAVTAAGVRVYPSANVSIPNATYTALAFNTETFDTDNYHSTSTNTSRLTIPTGKGGMYRVSWGITLDSSALGSLRIVAIRKNGSTTISPNQYAFPSASQPAIFYGSDLFQLVATDYIDLLVYQDTGSAKNVYTDSFLTMNFLGA